MMKLIMRSIIFVTAFSFATAHVLLPGSVAADEPKANQTLSFKLLLSGKKNQIAIWLTDDKDKFIDTIYVTRKIAQRGLGNRGGSLDDKKAKHIACLGL